MKKPTFLLMAAFLAGGLAFAVPGVAAQSIYTNGHGDLGVEYTPGETEFEPHWHIGAGAMVDGAPLAEGEEFAPGDLVARLSTTSNVGNASVADALGVSTGTAVYRTGITAYPPNLGFGLEEVGLPDDWLGGAITLTLTGFSGPGQMAISQTVSGLGTFVWFSSLGDGYTVADNEWEFAVGGHQHNDWWFSETGIYEVTFEWSGTYIGGGEPVDVTGAGTFGLQVGVIPEPGTWALLAAGGAMLVLLRRRSLARLS
ncbi:MAG TPA: choice-of-anchor M domain-containing protein [Chthoniobacteraceae bacterium]|nr:choice-of-anchor M domain-containing protein [Chthoniobacteraceae bacterium]